MQGISTRNPQHPTSRREGLNVKQSSNTWKRRDMNRLVLAQDWFDTNTREPAWRTMEGQTLEVENGADVSW